MGYLETFGPRADPVTTLGWGLLAISCAVILIVALLIVSGTWTRRDRAAAIAAAQIAAVVRLLFQQLERRRVAVVRPRDAARLQNFSERLDGREEFPLLYSEGADGEVDRRAFAQDVKDLDKRPAVFPP